MRDQDVPQDANIALGGHRKAVYARGADGNIHIVSSSGWQAEEIVTLQAVDDFKEKAAAAKQACLQNTVSPLMFHMYKQRMDLVLLAQSTGLFQWRIKRHFQPRIFKKLSAALLQRYADALGISVTTLTALD
ncbi:MAG: hypothetical protein H0W44_04505 [Gammaproteobacteria bacterium]|nr:hypothetical protein [Gammaproteobacteria bacterium]